VCGLEAFFLKFLDNIYSLGNLKIEPVNQYFIDVDQTAIKQPTTPIH
jgi:hypothetical protein